MHSLRIRKTFYFVLKEMPDHGAQPEQDGANKSTRQESRDVSERLCSVCKKITKCITPNCL